MMQPNLDPAEKSAFSGTHLVLGEPRFTSRAFKLCVSLGYVASVPTRSGACPAGSFFFFYSILYPRGVRTVEDLRTEQSSVPEEPRLPVWDDLPLMIRRIGIGSLSASPQPCTPPPSSRQSPVSGRGIPVPAPSGPAQASASGDPACYSSPAGTMPAPTWTQHGPCRRGRGEATKPLGFHAPGHRSLRYHQPEVPESKPGASTYSGSPLPAPS